MTKFMDWPFVESRASFREWNEFQEQRERLEFQKERDMDANALMLPVQNAKTSHEGLIDVIKANTAAWKEVRGDLATCNSQEKVQAIIYKVESALSELSIDSQKIPKWVKDGDDPDIPPLYGQYPIYAPINPDNPVPWPPGYVPPADPTTVGTTIDPTTVSTTTVGGKK